MRDKWKTASFAGAPRAVLHACLLLAAGVWQALALASEGELAPPPLPDINVLSARLADAVRDEPVLHGAYLQFELVRDPQDPEAGAGTLVFTRLLDRTKADEQRAALESMLRQWLPAGRYRFEPDRLYPFSELLAALEERIETHPQLGGCLVAGGYYAPAAGDTNDLFLVLQGRIAEEEQAPLVEAACTELLRRDPAWLRLDAGAEAASDEAALVFTPNTVAMVPGSQPPRHELAVLRPSAAKGRWFFNDGVGRYWSGDYAGAAATLRLAVLEAPDRLEYLYWWTLAELALGNRERAFARMLRAVRMPNVDRQDPSRQYQNVMLSLARVQGRVRHRLHDLEAEALLLASQGP